MRVLQENETHQVNGGVVIEETIIYGGIKVLAGLYAGLGTGLGFAALPFFSTAGTLTIAKVIGGSTLVGVIVGLFC